MANLVELSPDAAERWPRGVAPPVRWAPVADLPAADVAATVADWASYDGAIVAVGVSDGTSFTVSGSGVLVAPGLVFTATHVLRDEIDGIDAADISLWCVGPRRDGNADLWALTKLRFGETESDIAFLAVKPYSRLPDEWSATCLPVTTRIPLEGDVLTVVGFRFDNALADDLPEIEGVPVINRGHLYVSTGTVERIELHRDRVMAPFPVIEISCGTLGGMSGGAVLDANGAVVGILSAGLSATDGRGPSNAAWIIHALQFNVSLPWPQDVYPFDCPILDLPENLFRVIGREYVTVTGPLQIDYIPWR